MLDLSTTPTRGRKGKRAAAILLTSALALAGVSAAPLAASADSPTSFTVSGHIQNPDHSSAVSAYVELYHYDQSSNSYTYDDDLATSDDGNFSFANVPNGDYSLYIEDNDDDYYSPNLSVEVAGEDVVYPTVTFLATHDISGHVSTADGKAIPAGQTYVTLYGPQGFTQYPDVDSAGDWTVYGAPEGDYTDGHVGAKGYSDSDLDFTITSENYSTPISTTLQVAPRFSVSGKITAPSDVAGLVATLYDYSDDSVVATSSVNADGTYSVPGALGGYVYYLYVTDPQGAYAKTKYSYTYKNEDGTTGTADDITLYNDANSTGNDVKLATSLFTGTAASVSGTTGLGGVLTANVASTPAATYAYSWTRNGFTIPDATGASYTINAADQGTTLGVTVTLAKRAYATTTVGTTIAVPKAAAAPTTILKTLVKVATPKVSGSVKVGKTLKVSVKAAKTKGTTVKYQWYSNGKAIKKATKSSFKITKSLKGKKLSVKVVSSKKGYKTITKTVKIKGSVKK